MNLMQTYSGRRIDRFDLDPARVDIVDIAHSLANTCRFGGHCREFYSVAEHCVRVSSVVPKTDALWGLMHDAAEAYIGDIPTPIKLNLCAINDTRLTNMVELEQKVLIRIIVAFLPRQSLPLPVPRSVQVADMVLLATEVRDLMSSSPGDWGINAQPLPSLISPWPVCEARRAFLDRWRELKA